MKRNLVQIIMAVVIVFLSIALFKSSRNKNQSIIESQGKKIDSLQQTLILADSAHKIQQEIIEMQDERVVNLKRAIYILSGKQL